MPYPNDRRKNAIETDEVLSPEYLAMLMACGGEVRAEDRDAARSGGPEPRHQRRKSDFESPDGSGPDSPTAA